MDRSYEVTRTISAPAQLVWALLVDVKRHRKWNSSLVSIDGEMTDGGTVRLVSKVNPKREFSIAVSDVRAPHRMVWSDGMPLGLFRGVRKFELADRDGCTDFSMREVFSGPLAGPITRMIPDMTESFAEFADGLQAAAESAAPGTSETG